MNRVKHGVLKRMADQSKKISVNYLSDVVNGRKPISRSRARELSKLARKALGVSIPPVMWMFGPYPALKKAISGKGLPGKGLSGRGLSNENNKPKKKWMQ